METQFTKEECGSGNIQTKQTEATLSAAAAAAAKSLQSYPTLCDPIDGSPPGSPVPEILQARILEWVAISPLSPPSELQEIPVAIREQSGVLCFHAR